tara:strand:- start:18 stop:659 length:642 start_codon:yes stop_codon:yes gene_type:complete
MSIEYKFIAIEGNIGAGKTTLAKFLASRLNGSLLLEEFEDNQFLKEFYSGKGFAIHAELQFVLDRSKQLADFFDAEHKLIFSDYVPQKSLVFSEINLKAKEFKTVQSLTNELYKPFAQPDLIIYIDRDIDALIENIYKRGRSFEQQIDEQYIHAIMKGYNKWLKQLNQPVLRIKAQEIDMKKPTELEAAFRLAFSRRYSKNQLSLNLNELMKE